MQRLVDILKNFKNKKITVVGDVMLDKTIFGSVDRISPEAPVPVVKVESEIYELGGAANVAANISSLGGNVSLFGFAGVDENAARLSKRLEEKRIEYYFGESDRTTLKVRIRSGVQQMLRLDHEISLSKGFNARSMEKMEEEIKNSEMILVSDYGKGVINSALMSFLKSFGKRIVIDPKPNSFSLYRDSFIVTPNEREALNMAASGNDIILAGRYIVENLHCNVLITRGKNGMILFPKDNGKEMDIPTYARDVYDVTGAGDTAIAALSLSLASGASLEESAIIANHAAGIAVGKIGTYHVPISELEKEIFGKETKLKKFDELSNLVLDLKEKGKRIVWTSGCFDILHQGHTKYLARAKELGDYLIVGLNSDSSVRKLKGSDRPINIETTRAEILSALACVDYITVFSEISPLKCLESIRPEIYAKGGNYTLSGLNQEEKRIVESYGGRIVLIDVGEKTSTTGLIERVKTLYENK